MKRILIIPTAGLATRIAPVSNYFPKALVPFGDEPIVAKILSLYCDVHLDKVILVISPGTEGRYQALIQAYSLCIPIELCIQLQPAGLLGAIITAKQAIAQSDQVCVHLADTLLQKKFREDDFQESFVIVGQVQTSGDWCMVRTNTSGDLLEMMDKPKRSDSALAIAGVYFFSQAALLAETFVQVIHETEMSAAVHLYIRHQSIKVRLRTDWSDLGDLRRFHTLAEHFNTHKKVRVYRQENIVIKKSASEKLIAEEYFYRHAKSRSSLPRLLTSSPKKLQFSYQPARSLAYYALFEPMLLANSQHVLESMWQTMHTNFYRSEVHWSEARLQTQWMYGQRIVESIEREMPDLTELSQIEINGEILYGWPHFHDLILRRAKKLAHSAVIRHIHGDLHFGNILYDPLSHTFLFIDPRGKWGQQLSIYGDIRYDIAKLLHSFHGSYEYMKRGLAHFQEHSLGNYSLHTPADPWQTIQSVMPLLATYHISMADVLWIEALCFLSMCCCYADRHLRKQFFLQGIYLLNQLL